MSDQPIAVPEPENTGIDCIPSESAIAALKQIANYTGSGRNAKMAPKIASVMFRNGVLGGPENRKNVSYRALWEDGARYLMDPTITPDLQEALATLRVFKNLVNAGAFEDGVTDAMNAYTEGFLARLEDGLTNANRGEKIEALLPPQTPAGPARFINLASGGRSVGASGSTPPNRGRAAPDSEPPAIGNDQ